MTVIRPNSVSGITSITAQANEINFFRSNGTLAGLQLNGVNFNTTTGVSTFNNLDVGGVLTYQDVTNVDSVGIITARSGLNVSGGTATFAGNVDIADTIYHTGDSNTKIRFPANDTISLHTSGDERLKITSTGLIYVNGDGTGGRIDATAGDGSMTFSDGNGRQTLKIKTMGSGQSAAHVFDASGRLGIGTDNPSQELTVYGTDPIISIQEATVSSQVDMGTGTSTGFINIQKADGTRTIQFNGSGDSFIATGGDFGIGITSPAVLTHIYDSTNTSTATEQFRISGGNRSADNFETGFRFFTQSPSANGNRHIVFTSNGNTGLVIQPYETSTGNAAADRHIALCPSGGSVYIGTNSSSFSPHTAADNLVVGSTSGSNGMTILTGSATGNIFFNDGSGNDGVVQYVHSATPNYMRISSSGWIRLSAGGNNHGGGVFCREKVCTTSGTNIFSFSCTHGALAGTLYAICSNGGFSVSKIYQFCGKHGASTFTLVADSGAYSGKNFSVTRTASADLHTFKCTTSGANNVEISFTFYMGAPNQDVTYTEL